MSYRDLKRLIVQASREAAKEMDEHLEVPVHFLCFRAGWAIAHIDQAMLERMPHMDLDDSRCREALGETIRVLLSRFKCDGYLHYAEAWVVQGEPGEDFEFGDASRHPRRYEIIHYVAEDRTGRQLQGMQSIIRPSLGAPYLDADLTIMKCEMIGRFAGMFKQREEEQGDANRSALVPD